MFETSIRAAWTSLALSVTGDGRSGSIEGLGGSAGDGLAALLKVILALLVIIGLIVWLLRLLSRRGRMFRTHQAMQSWGGVPLGQNKSLQLGEVGGVFYLIGVGDEVRLIDKITSPEEAERLRQLLAEREAAGVRTFTRIRDWLDRRTPAAGAARDENEPDSPSFHELIHRKMRQLNEQRRQQMDGWLEQEEAEERTKKP